VTARVGVLMDGPMGDGTVRSATKCWSAPPWVLDTCWLLRCGMFPLAHASAMRMGLGTWNGLHEENARDGVLPRF
jgi:hypothetical protein